MSWVQHANVVVEIWGGLFCIIAAICTRASRHNNKIAAGCLAGFCLLVASRVFGFYYAFDEQNRYYRLNDKFLLDNN